MSERNNPASRLHSILEESKDGQHRQKSVMQMWADVFEINLEEPDGPLRLIGQLANLKALIHEVREKISGMDVRQSLYLKHFEKIENATRIDQLGAAWSTSESQLSEATMDSLEHCSELLSSAFSEDDISESIVEIKDKVENLSEEVIASDLDEPIKNFILKELEVIRRGIFDYRLKGASGLRESVATTIGDFMLSPDVSQSTNDKGFLSKLKTLIVDTEKITSSAMRLKALAGTAANNVLEMISQSST
ncbi:hypothetical protein [Mariprofundus sp. KV]|uniref:hypothetical protein n=1 Tax=Mariprofundus sp. KV TaxID=2608715 RepID=UPI0015A3243F|nr:hypothetical protein [Mariprofundus sp. KV]NWF36065.1 hypothetical protein [Mariprofundus sp. KV]